MIRNSLTYVAIGKHLGMSGSGVLRLISGKRMPVKRHAQLLELGVPEYLLPYPLDVPRGPKKKNASPSA